jgi:diguanylate cyclase (GGDEF)-like protein
VDRQNTETDLNPFQNSTVETISPMDQLIEFIAKIAARIQESSGESVQEFKNNTSSGIEELKSMALDARKYERDRVERLVRRISNLQRSLEEARAEAARDKLTGLADNVCFDIMLLRWIATHKNSGDPFTVALVDIDNFGKINDDFGRPVGDQVLTFAALEIGRNIRERDFLARCNSDKFAILSSGMALADAEKRFSKLVQKIGAGRLSCRNEKNEPTTASFTVSCGIAEYAPGESAKELINRAQNALYDAKRLGKNRVAAKLRFSAYYEARKQKPVA